MEGFKFKLKTTEVDFELGIDKMEENDKDFIREILRMMDRKSATLIETMDKEELKEKYKNAAEGYKLFDTGNKGFHKGVDEYILQEVEEELKEEQKEDIELTEEVTAEINEEVKGRLATFTYQPPNIVEDSSIRTNNNNENLYQTFYVCPKCKNKGKRYIPKHAIHTNCHSCYHQMRVKPASYKGFPERDKFGNIFVAGSFKQETEADVSVLVLT